MAEPLYREGPLMFAAQPLRFTINLAIVIASVIAAFQVSFLFYPGLILASAALLVLLWWAIDNHFTTVVVDTERITHRYGVFNRSHVEVERSQIRTVRVTQSLVDRIFGCGKLAAISVGDRADIIQDGLPDVDRLRTVLRAG